MQGLWANTYMRRVAVQSTAQQDGFSQLVFFFCFVSKLSPFFFLSISASSANATTFMLLLKAFPTLNISTPKPYCTSDYALRNLFFLLAVLIFCYLTSYVVWIYLEVIATLLFLQSFFFFKCVNKTLSKLNFRKSGLQSWKSFWTQNFCKSTYQNSYKILQNGYE